MTEVQSLLISIPCKLLRLRHFLWYAHASKSRYLYLTFPFLTGLVSSTKGSCPKSGKKVTFIGQGVVNQFDDKVTIDPRIPPLKWYYVGRLDASKRIDLVIAAIKDFREKGWSLELHLFGEPSSSRDKNYINTIKKIHATDISDGWLHFQDSVPHSQLPEVLANFDGFIHAFPGSLDKTLVEAVLARRHVVTTHGEFHEVFQQPSNLEDDALQTLLYLLKEVIQLDSSAAKKIIDERYKIAKFHTMDEWTKRLVEVLKDE
jgi:glycosyltransferase involved in cell wall biosynthesis